MKAKLMNVTCSAQRCLLVTAALSLHHVAMAMPASSISDFGVVFQNAEDHAGDAVSVKAKIASLRAFAGGATPALGASFAGPIGGAGFTPFSGGGAGAMTPAGIFSTSASGTFIPYAAGNSPAGVPFSTVLPTLILGATGTQPGGTSSLPATLLTPPTGNQSNVTGLSGLPGLPAVVAMGGTPANSPSSLAPIAPGGSGTALPLTASTPGAVGAALAPVPESAGAVAQGASPNETAVGVRNAAVSNDTTVVPDSGGTLMLFSLGLAILLGVRGRLLPLN